MSLKFKELFVDKIIMILFKIQGDQKAGSIIKGKFNDVDDKFVYISELASGKIVGFAIDTIDAIQESANQSMPTAEDIEEINKEQATKLLEYIESLESVGINDENDVDNQEKLDYSKRKKEDPIQ